MTRHLEITNFGLKLAERDTAIRRRVVLITS